MSAILFDREQVDRLDELPRRPERLNGAKLLWVDIDRRGDEDVTEIAQRFDLDESTTAQLTSSSGRAVFHDFGRYIHLTTYSPCDDDDADLIALECVVGKNWVITAHDQPVAVLQEFADRVSGSGDTGVLDGPAFLATCSNGYSAPTRPRSNGWSSDSRSLTCRRCAVRVGPSTTSRR